jgi:hypothetical protein
MLMVPLLAVARGKEEIENYLTRDAFSAVVGLENALVFLARFWRGQTFGRVEWFRSRLLI